MVCLDELHTELPAKHAKSAKKKLYLTFANFPGTACRRRCVIFPEGRFASAGFRPERGYRDGARFKIATRKGGLSRVEPAFKVIRTNHLSI
jgi:hypothetical protein